MPQISLDWDAVKAAYPTRHPLLGALQAVIDQLGPGNTPCCLQMSHALSAAGCMIGPRSNWRANWPITTAIGRHYYILTVSEMNAFLSDRFGAGDELASGGGSRRRQRDEMRAALDGRTGILVFGRKHTELWDCDHMHQRDMSYDLFNEQTVLFWDVMITAEA